MCQTTASSKATFVRIPGEDTMIAVVVSLVPCQTAIRSDMGSLFADKQPRRGFWWTRGVRLQKQVAYHHRKRFWSGFTAGLCRQDHPFDRSGSGWQRLRLRSLQCFLHSQWTSLSENRPSCQWHASSYVWWPVCKREVQIQRQNFPVGSELRKFAFQMWQDCCCPEG